MSWAISRAIAKAMADTDHLVIELVEQQYQEAKAIVATIPSGTRDADLTTKQRRALTQYESAMRRLKELRSS